MCVIGASSLSPEMAPSKRPEAGVPTAHTLKHPPVEVDKKETLPVRG